MKKILSAFSLVEVLAAVTLIGIIVFLALPNIVRVKEDGEEHLAIARSEALNLAMASYVQARGSSAATAGWSGAADDEAKYDLIKPYLAYAPLDLAGYLPSGYAAVFEDLEEKVTLNHGNDEVEY